MVAYFAVKIKTCVHSNVIYCISCNKSSCHNIQQEGDQLKGLENIQVTLKVLILTQPIGNHFNLPGHTLSNMKVTVFEKCKENNSTYQKIRESYFINHIPRFKKFREIRLGSKLSLDLIYGLSFRIKAASNFLQS